MATNDTLTVTHRRFTIKPVGNSFDIFSAGGVQLIFGAEGSVDRAKGVIDNNTIFSPAPWNPDLAPWEATRARVLDGDETSSLLRRLAELG